jgi:hypothetical protein
LAVEGLELAERQNELASGDPNSLDARLAVLRVMAARLEIEIRKQMVETGKLSTGDRFRAERMIEQLQIRQIEFTKQTVELLRETRRRLGTFGIQGWMPFYGPTETMSISMSLSLPTFWPVPTPSSIYVLPQEYFRQSPDQVLHLHHIDERIRLAMNECGYVEWSYFAVPDGFAMVTRLEQIKEDGSPSEDRWSTKVRPLEPGQISFMDYIRAMFTSNAGYYRIIVFVVTHVALDKEDVQVSQAEAIAWLAQGCEFLPDEVRQIEYGAGYHCTALVYEFEQANPGVPPDPSVPGRLPAHEHLRMAKLLTVLGK